jgi:hypothetical protein
MSKLIDILKRVSQPPPQPIGFKAANSETRLKIQLIANVPGISIADISEKTTGADALLLTLSDTEMKKSKKTTVDIKGLWGAWLPASSKDGIDRLSELGSDFVVFSATTSILTTQSDKTGKIIQIEPSINDLLLRSINELPIDGVLLSGISKDGNAFTWQNLMSVHRFTSLLNKPLLIEVPASITDKELQVIWEAGVEGIIVTIDNDKFEATLQNLRQTIDSLTFPAKKKREKIVPTLPRVENKEPEPEENEEEDE